MKRNTFSASPQSQPRDGVLRSGHPPSENRSSGAYGAESAYPLPETTEATSVRVGSTIGIRDLRSGEYEEYTLVPPDDADILEHRISTHSPIGSALFGRNVGDVVEFDAPSGRVKVRVERIAEEVSSAPAA